MKRYLLTIVASFESEEICQDIIIAFSPIVDSPNIKFQYNSKGLLMVHFESKVEKTEIYEYVGGVLFQITETFILTEINDNVSVSFPLEVKGHLFDLENVDGSSTNFEMNKIKKSFEVSEEENDYINDFLHSLSDNINTKIKKPTLDYLLDKITEKGFESLTQYEKDILENYSK